MTKILEVKDLEISFDTYAGKVRAIRGVNFHLNKGETLAIVGESGSGKSVTTRSIMRLLSSNANMLVKSSLKVTISLENQKERCKKSVVKK